MTASFDDLIEQRLEFGVNELGLRDFGRLAARMNAVDPEWRPRAKHRRLIAIELLRDGVPEKRIAMQLRISRTTLWRLRAEALKSGPESRIASRSNVSNEENPTRRPDRPCFKSEPPLLDARLLSGEEGR
jgi:hypothetical protein